MEDVVTIRVLLLRAGGPAHAVEPSRSAEHDLVVETVRLLQLVPVEGGEVDLRAALGEFEAKGGSPAGGAWAAFTSRHAVEATWSALAQGASSSEAKAQLRALKVAAVGPRTRNSLSERGIPCELCLEGAEAQAGGLARALVERGAKDVLWPRSRQGGDLAELLRKAGAKVREVVLYEERVDPAGRELLSTRLTEPQIPAVGFTSEGGVAAAEGLLRPHAPSEAKQGQGLLVGAIGATTAAPLLRLGFHPLVPAAPSVDALVELLRSEAARRESSAPATRSSAGAAGGGER